MKPSLTLGDITITRIVEQERLPFMDFKAFFPTLTDEVLAENRAWLEPRFLEPQTGRIVITVQSYLVRTRHHTILVDTCVGNHKPRPARPVWNMLASDVYERNLASAGVSLGDIDYVMCTHLHGDHVGWNTRLENGRWVPTFPNARYLLSGKELAFWSDQHGKSPDTCLWIGDSVLPVVEAGRAEKVSSDHVLGDDVRLLPTPGHTIDHYAVGVGRAGADAVITGDMVHSPLQMRYPGLGMVVDYDRDAGAASRRGMFERCCDTATWLCTAHFPETSIGRVTRWGDGYRFVEA